MSYPEALKELGDRGFAGHGGFGSFPALVVIDFTNAFTNPAHRLGSEVGPQIAEANRLAAAFRAKNLPVFYTTIAYATEEEARSSNWSRKIEGVASLFHGSPDTEQDSRLERRPDEPVIAKKYASSFFGTDLDQRLRQAGVDTLVIVGCSTSGCVRATAVDACQNGYFAVVCREAVADRDPNAHSQALTDITLKYGDVLSREEIETLVAEAIA